MHENVTIRRRQPPLAAAPSLEDNDVSHVTTLAHCFLYDHKARFRSSRACSRSVPEGGCRHHVAQKCHDKTSSGSFSSCTLIRSRPPLITRSGSKTLGVRGYCAGMFSVLLHAIPFSAENEKKKKAYSMRSRSSTDTIHHIIRSHFQQH